MLIRPFVHADYPEIARITTATFPDYPSTPEELEFQDTHNDPKCRQARWVAEDNGVAVGFAEYGQRASAYHPQRFHFEIIVQPSHQGQGFGKALYEQIMAALAEFDPLSVRTHTREDMARSMRFLTERGFAEDMRSFESRLDVRQFDPSPHADAEARVLAQGIEFHTLAELEHSPEHYNKHYAMIQEIVADVPTPEPHTPVTKEVWRRRFSENPNLMPEAFIFAVHAGEYVGVTMLHNSPGNDYFYTGLTGVTRPYRRQGIALALKLRAIAWAKTSGRSSIRTWNESNNRGMLGINAQLGFVRQPAWLDLVKHLKEENTHDFTDCTSDGNSL